MNEDEKKAYEASDREDGLRRRDFLKILGGSFAALAAGCAPSTPTDRIVPLAEQGEGQAPGVSRWYASTCGACPAACGVLVKSRDGRPIKMEGNPEHPLSRGGLCARGQASVLDLYDSARLRGPLNAAAATSWSVLDEGVAAALSAARRQGKKVRLLTRTAGGPALAAAAAGFCAAHGAELVVYDSISAAAIVEAHRRTHGRAVLPHYRFEAARAIVSFDADFLGSWISPVEFTRSWAGKRRPDDGFEGMSWHAQFEPRMSLTGANADLRVPLKPSEEFAAVAALGGLLARRTGRTAPRFTSRSSSVPAALLEQTADGLLRARNSALVVSGSSDVAVQVLVNWMNELLGGYGRTVDIARPSFQARGRDGALETLIEEMESGAVGALFVLDANPAFDHPLAAAFSAASAKVGAVVALSERRDETALLARYTAVVPHALESWGDAEPVAGVRSLFQPLIAPLFDSRPAIESLLAWSGRRESAHDFTRRLWREAVYPRAKEKGSFDEFWDSVLQRGAVTLDAKGEKTAAFAASALAGLSPARKPAAAGEFELAAHPSHALYDGRQANNPWLQELPDPVTKLTWGNAACFSPADAARLGLEDGRMVRLSFGSRVVELPALIQKGQADGVVAAALGYGRTAAGPIAADYPTVKFLPIEKDLAGGADVYPLSAKPGVAVAVLSATTALARTQTYDSLTVPFTGQTRPIIIETTLQDYFKLPPGEANKEELESLWPRHAYDGHKWGLAVNLTACTGCAGCAVACQAENNVPVVGKAEVRKGREMTWLRIDRYYGGEKAETDPDVAFQPMMCQHCDDAPCETVCPVLATVHSTEGLNMQVYNRCVGTRYCANNCPYKVRRFNWFDYAHGDDLKNLSLNPDVTVRSRGVMEKCSFCVQRIYSADFQAKTEGRELRDGDITPACAQSCPAEAIVFGDLNDPESKVSRAARENHGFRVLAELGVGPSVFYGVKVRNTRVKKS